MKLTPLPTRIAALFSVLFVPLLAQAHPGHSALDWTAGAPHAGHEGEWATLFAAVLVVVAGYGFRWLASRKK